MKTKYKNSIETERKFKLALGELISETHDVNTISVSQIVKRMGVNRGTFYNHYDSINDLIDSIYLDIIEYIKSLNHEPNTSVLNPSEYVHKIIEFIQSENQFYRYIVPYSSRKLINKLKNSIIEMMMDNNELKQHCNCHEDEFLFRISFTVNGMIDIFIDYLCGNITISEEKLVQYFIDTINRELIQ